MAYIAFAETGTGIGTDMVSLNRPRHDPVPALHQHGFTALEWSVIALAQNDPLSSLRTPGRLSIALGTVFGGRANPRLADSRLEALRRMAVLVWHHSFALPKSDYGRFLDAGFTAAQHDTLLASIAAARSARAVRR